ncbi:unnamed protein product [Trichogramma brassicae]|uniref:Uncharacterized protein n=1 Tax=Trichogramma brassicae TaxID=86971 RepID=A0A6H5I1R4_9HYME|nr:unnamed protein product [Trichogramma brassicae]
MPDCYSRGSRQFDPRSGQNAKMYLFFIWPVRKCLVPEFVDSRKRRSMQIRNTRF